MKCHCGGEAIAHGDENPFKVGAFHCDACGCCMYEDGTNRVGHPGCGGYHAEAVEFEVVAVEESPTPKRRARRS